MISGGHRNGLFELAFFHDELSLFS
jgi:hypothetical protein